MSTVEYFTNSEELKKLYSSARATITAPFYGNNVEHVKTVSEAYKLAKNSPGTVELTGMPVYMPEKVGLPQQEELWVNPDVIQLICCQLFVKQSTIRVTD